MIEYNRSSYTLVFRHDRRPPERAAQQRTTIYYSYHTQLISVYLLPTAAIGRYIAFRRRRGLTLRLTAVVARPKYYITRYTTRLANR